jgi:hypothetical protein
MAGPSGEDGAQCTEQRYAGDRDAHDRSDKVPVAIFRLLYIFAWAAATVGILVGHAVLWRSCSILLGVIVASCGIVAWSFYWAFGSL